jgi:hypothetical protein
LISATVIYLKSATGVTIPIHDPATAAGSALSVTLIMRVVARGFQKLEGVFVVPQFGVLVEIHPRSEGSALLVLLGAKRKLMG